MCKQSGGKIGNLFPAYRNFQEGAGMFPRYIMPSQPASKPIAEEAKSFAELIKKSLPKRARKTRVRKPRRRTAKKNLIQNGSGQKRRRRRGRKGKSKPKKKRSRKSPKQTGGIRSFQKKKKRRVRKRVYKKGARALVNNNSSNFNF